MDCMFSENSRGSFRYGQTPWLNYAKLVWGNNAAEPSNQYPSTRIARNWGADWTYTLTPAWSSICAAAWRATKAFRETASASDYRSAAIGISRFAGLAVHRPRVPALQRRHLLRARIARRFQLRHAGRLEPAAQRQLDPRPSHREIRRGIPPLQRQQPQSRARQRTV